MIMRDCTTSDEVAGAVREWVAAEVPSAWREAAERGGPSLVRTVRTRSEYQEWYPAFARSGLVVPQWPAEYGGLGWPRPLAQAAERVLARYHLPRLNPLGLNLTAAALFAHGTHEQRLRFLPYVIQARRSQ